MFELIKSTMLLLRTMTGSIPKIALMTTLVMLSACTPSEKELTSEDLLGDTSQGGFEGAVLAQTISATQVRLSWDASTNERLNGYHIYDATIAPAPVLIKTVDKDTIETTISGLAPGFLKKFRVRLITTLGEEDGNVNDLYAIPYSGVTSSTVISSTEVLLNYTSPASGEASLVRSYCQIGVDTSWTLMSTVTDLSLSSLQIAGLVPNTAYRCRVNVVVDGKEDNNLARVDFVALGQADRMVFLTEPGNGQAGSLLTVQPVVQILDENDNIVSGGPDSIALVTLTIAASSPTSGTVSGTFALNAVAGVADFTDLFMNESGVKILEAIKEDTSSLPFGTAAMTVESASFNITSGAVSPALSTLVVDFAGGGTPVANGGDTYTVTFNLNDEFGNPVTGTRPEFASNIPGDFISQPLTSTDAAGQTTGTLSTTVSDTNTVTPRSLNISSPAGLTTITTLAPFDPGAANRVAFVAQPTNSPAGDLAMNEVRVAVQDTNGNIITSGIDASATISLSINNNIGGAVLSGVTSKAATAGIAIFDDLGIDLTDNGYSLVAAGGVLNPGFSNNFNITAGVPKVIAMEGPTSTLSGECSTAITLQLRDFGGNPARAVTITTVQLSGLGNASLYTSGSCGGSAIGSNVTFTPGTDTQILYLQSEKVEDLNIVGTDASTVLTSSNYNIQSTVSQLSIAVIGGNPLEVPAGACSTALEISPLSADGSDGEVFSTTNVTLTGITGSQALVYSDDTCSTVVDPSSFPLTMAAVPSHKTRVYIQDPRGETLLVNVADPAGDISTISTPKDVIVGPSNIHFTGPSTVVSGVCSAVFNIRLRDTEGNNTVTASNKTLRINGLGSYPTGSFYTSPACGGGGSSTSLIVPAASSLSTIYFRGFASAVLSIQITDDSGDLADSQTIGLSVTPSAFRIVAPAPAESYTSECKGPFVLETLDGLGDPADAVDPITANLSGAGDAGLFYNDAACAAQITSLSFATSEGSKNYYFKGQYPESSLTLLATDAAAILVTASQAWVVLPDLGWLGTASAGFDEFGDLLPFRIGVKPVAARYDGFRGIQQMAFDPTGQFLYLTDTDNDRIVKYDYTNHEYIGWMGRLRVENGIGSTGSNVPTPSPALCVSTTNNEVLPGWCVGGRSIGGSQTTGGLQNPWGITVDDTYIYTTSRDQHYIARHRADTGAFEGFLGWSNSVGPTGNATGGPASCSATGSNSLVPGWCVGGNTRYHNVAQVGDGRLRYPEGIEHDASNLYVATERAVLRYDKVTGAFTGWIGRVSTVSPTGGAAGCTATGDDQITPGWCVGGTYEVGGPAGGAVYNARDLIIVGTHLYVLNSRSGGVINKYDVATGAFVETLPNLNGTWTNPLQIVHDGTNFYIADDERLLRVDETGLQLNWMGKVANNVGMSGEPGCDSLSPNDDTPGWCLGGTHKPGLGETSFLNTFAIAYDGVNSLLAASREYPAIKKFNKTTGVYEGSMGLDSVSPETWTADNTANSEYEGFDDQSMNAPRGSVVVGDFIFITELNNSRVKKINKKTGEVIGIIGGMTESATGGDPGCAISNDMSPAPGWCTGATPYPTFTWNDANMIDDLSDGIMYQPWGITSDGTWIYITDYALHRVQRFRVDNGFYGGWIGRINVPPTGGDPGCAGAPNNSFTPGWCYGGISEVGTNAIDFDNPTGITYTGGNIYVIDTDHHKVSSYNATTGAFNGWIGRVNAAPSSGCTTTSNGNYNVSGTGWCIGGTSSRANFRNDRGGGFNFDRSDRAGIYTDGTHLYIANTWNIRVDKYTLGGTFVEAARTRPMQYVNVWQSSQVDVAAVGNGISCSFAQDIFVDATHIYGIVSEPCTRTGDTVQLFKMDKATGTIIGWKGGIDGALPPTGGDPGCSGATGVTPGWCTGGRVAVGVKKGQFSGNNASISGDAEFIYITDNDNNRIHRVPK